MTKGLVAASTLLCALIIDAGEPAAQRQPLRIAAGPELGLYAPLARTLCDLSEAEGLPCEAIITAGSAENAAMLAQGTADMALVQSDLAGDMLDGKGAFADIGPLAITAVLDAHPEPLTLLVQPDSEIADLEGLYGTRLMLAQEGSGAQLTWRAVFRKVGLDEASFAALDAGPSDVQDEAFCSGEIDALALVLGHPSNRLEQLLSRCDARLVSIEDVEATQLLEHFPTFEPTAIDGRDYAHIGRVSPATASIGPYAMLVAAPALSAAWIEPLVQAVFERNLQLREAAPAFALLEPGRLIPSHPIVPMNLTTEAYLNLVGQLEPQSAEGEGAANDG